MPKKKASIKDDPYSSSKSSIQTFFREAVEKDEFLLPDDAMKKFAAFVNQAMKVLNLDTPTLKRDYPKLDEVVFLRQLHHYAVDLFYETYFGKRDGAPPINEEHLRHLVILQAKGYTHGEIAMKLGYPTSPSSELRKSSDKVRKRLDIAKKRGITPSSVEPSKQKSES